MLEKLRFIFILLYYYFLSLGLFTVKVKHAYECVSETTEDYCYKCITGTNLGVQTRTALMSLIVQYTIILPI